jgi:hypothetical protein
MSLKIIEKTEYGLIAEIVIDNETKISIEKSNFSSLGIIKNTETYETVNSDKNTVCKKKDVFTTIDFNKYFIELHYIDFFLSNGYFQYIIADNLSRIEEYVLNELADKDTDRVILINSFKKLNGNIIGFKPTIIGYKIIDDQKIAVCNNFTLEECKGVVISRLIRIQNDFVKSIYHDETDIFLKRCNKILTKNYVDQLYRLVTRPMFDFMLHKNHIPLAKYFNRFIKYQKIIENPNISIDDIPDEFTDEKIMVINDLQNAYVGYIPLDDYILITRSIYNKDIYFIRFFKLLLFCFYFLFL